MLYREIGITDIDGVLVGHAQRKELGSGCTAVLVEKGALCGCDVRGGSPATRDTQALRSEMSNQKIYGVVLILFSLGALIYTPRVVLMEFYNEYLVVYNRADKNKCVNGLFHIF